MGGNKLALISLLHIWYRLLQWLSSKKIICFKVVICVWRNGTGIWICLQRTTKRFNMVLKDSPANTKFEEVSQNCRVLAAVRAAFLVKWTVLHISNLGVAENQSFELKLHSIILSGLLSSCAYQKYTKPAVMKQFQSHARFVSSGLDKSKV